MIGHDPHELAAFLSAVLQGYTQSSAQGELERVFSAQYTLTLTEEIQIRTYTDEDGDTHAVSYTHLDVYKRQATRWTVLFHFHKGGSFYGLCTCTQRPDQSQNQGCF